MAPVAPRTGPCPCGQTALGHEEGEEDVTSAFSPLLPEAPRVWREWAAPLGPPSLRSCQCALGPICRKRGSFHAGKAVVDRRLKEKEAGQYLGTGQRPSQTSLQSLRLGEAQPSPDPWGRLIGPSSWLTSLRVLRLILSHGSPTTLQSSLLTPFCR